MQTYYKIMATIFGILAYISIVELLFGCFHYETSNGVDLAMTFVCFIVSTIMCSDKLSKIK